MKLLIALLLSVIVASPALAAPDSIQGKLKGWDYLAMRLQATGWNASDVEALFRDKRMPEFTPIPYNPRPAEPKALYQDFLLAKNLEAFKECWNKYNGIFANAGSAYHVDPELLAALIFVETRCGEITGRELVLYRLARLASVADPKNVAWNLDRLSEEVARGEYTEEEVRSRAQVLEEKFLPELRALKIIADSLGISPFEVIGSSAGAFGIPQFLPSSYLRFAVDGNANKRISLFEFEDAAFSAANYLSVHGLRSGAKREALMEALWAYNKSIPYGETILSVASTITDKVNLQEADT